MTSTRQRLQKVLDDLQAGKITVEVAMDRLGRVGYEDLGFARIDVHRRQRRGAAEVILCQNKTADQIVGIVRALDKAGENVFCTRVPGKVATSVKRRVRGLTHNKIAGTLYKENHPPVRKKGQVAVICGGTSDLPVAEEAAVTAEILGSPVVRIYDVGVAGIHRLLAESDTLRKAKVIVAVAGMEGALPSVVGGLVESPVVAVPTSIGYGASFGGLAALLGMLNSCSTGVSVVNIDNGFGAGYFAHLVNQ